jgi:acyl-CoA thioester hydrolase
VSDPVFHFSTSIKIRFRDLDAFGHVNNAVFFTYMEVARTDYFTHVGLLKNEWPPVFFIIAEATCQFKAPIQMDTPLVIQVRVSGLRNSSFSMEYRFVDQATGDVLALGRTAQVMYDYSANHSVALPAEWRQTLTGLEAL